MKPRSEWHGAEARVLRLLERAASAGADCPSNDEIAGLLGFSSNASSVRLVNKLADRGLITVRRTSQARQVTIVATGQSTAPIDGLTRSSREAGNDEDPPGISEVAVGCSGPELAAAIKRAAETRGVSLKEFLRPMRKQPYWLTELARADRPTSTTVNRVNALIEGKRVPPARGYERSYGDFAEPPAKEPAAPPRQPSREPCFYCGTRGDLGCEHQRPAAELEAEYA